MLDSKNRHLDTMVQPRMIYHKQGSGAVCLPGFAMIPSCNTCSELPNDGDLPRITQLMALAIHFDGLIQSGVVTTYAELARRGNVTRARVTQIMNLLMLAPEIQEELLFLPRWEQGRGEVCLRDLQRVAAIIEWMEQWAFYVAGEGILT